MALLLEHGEQRHMQRPSHHGVKALLQSGSLQQAANGRPAYISAGHNHREQDRGSYRHLYWTPAAGILHDKLHIFLLAILVIYLHLTMVCCVFFGSLY